jgi:hypothetical protein
MIRALSLSCMALLLVGLTGSVAFAGKPSIAVLGLEVIDQAGTPTAADTQVAKELSDGLRARAKAGTGPYQLAPGSDKELIDQKLLNNCDNEAPSCMSSIGNQLGAEILMFGRLEKQGKQYQVTLKVLDVGRKAVLKSSSDMIPMADANGATLQGWAKKMYGRLTGESSGSTLIVKLANAERGTILIDGEPKGTITNGSGQVSLTEGKYRVTVESEGFRRWEKDVSLSGSQTLPVELERSSGGGGIGVGGGFGGGGDGRVDGPKRGSTTWKGAAIAAVVVSGGGIAIGLYGNSQRFDARDKLCKSGIYNPEMPTEKNKVIDASCPKPSAAAESDRLTKQQIDDLNAQGTRGKWMGRIGAGVAIGAGGFALYAIYRGFVEKQPASSERNVRGRRVTRDRFVVTPIVSPDGGGATLRLDW